MHNDGSSNDLGVDKSFKDLTCDVVSALAKYHRLLDDRRRAPAEDQIKPYFKSASTAYGTFSRPFLKLPYSESRLRLPFSRDSATQTQTAQETTPLTTASCSPPPKRPVEEVAEIQWESPGEERITVDVEVQTMRVGSESLESSPGKVGEEQQPKCAGEERVSPGMASVECSTVESNDEEELITLEASVLQEHDLLVAAGLMVGKSAGEGGEESERE